MKKLMDEVRSFTLVTTGLLMLMIVLHNSYPITMKIGVLLVSTFALVYFVAVEELIRGEEAT